MVKIEDYTESDDSSEVEVLDRTVSNAGPSCAKPRSTPISAKEKDLPSSSCGHLKSYFVGMGFSPTLVEKVIEENGEDDTDLLLEALFANSAPQKSSPEASYSLDGFSNSDKEEDNSPIEFTTSDNEEVEVLDEPSSVDMDKKSYLLMMNFSEKEVDLALNRLGEFAPLAELVDFIVGDQTTGCSGGTDENGYVNGDNEKNEEYTAQTLFGTMEKTLRLLQMGFSEDEVSTAIDNFGPEVPITELADSIFANRMAYRVDKEELLHKAAKWSDHQYPLKEEWGTNGFDATVDEYEDVKRVKKIKHMAADATVDEYEDIKRVKKIKDMAANGGRAASSSNMAADGGRAASSSNHGKQARVAERETADARMIKEEIPDQVTPNLRGGNVRSHLSKPPYFFYGNVVDVPQETWQKFSQFLYGIEPEYVNSQFFSAFIRKEGYFHNLPTENRFHVLPKPSMTIEDALPHTKRWWPSWDTRKQLSCINPETPGVARLCERLGNMMADSKGLLSKEQQMDILHQCKTLNLIWVGEYKLSSIEPDQVERILGYPMQHTQIWGWGPSDRLRALKYCFQTDTLGYHLSVLKDLYPDGLRVLSVYSGIGGAEVALQRLGIRIRCVVSVEASEINQEILKRWWVSSQQSGELVQIGGIEKLTSQKLEGYVEQFDGFDIIVGGNPGTWVPGSSIGGGSVGMDQNLFFEFARVLQRVRGKMSRNS